MTKRAQFIAVIIDLLRTWYRYGGRDPGTGLDCMGLVIYALKKVGGPDLADWWTDRAWNEWPAVEEKDLLPGDLVFYGGDPNNPKDVSHVGVHIADGVVVTASGGGQTTTSISIAMKQGARVKVKDRLRYRNPDDLRGFRRIPFLQGA